MKRLFIVVVLVGIMLAVPEVVLDELNTKVVYEGGFYNDQFSSIMLVGGDAISAHVSIATIDVDGEISWVIGSEKFEGSFATIEYADSVRVLIPSGIGTIVVMGVRGNVVDVDGVRSLEAVSHFTSANISTKAKKTNPPVELPAQPPVDRSYFVNGAAADTIVKNNEGPYGFETDMLQVVANWLASLTDSGTIALQYDKGNLCPLAREAANMNSPMSDLIREGHPDDQALKLTVPDGWSAQNVLNFLTDEASGVDEETQHCQETFHKMFLPGMMLGVGYNKTTRILVLIARKSNEL